MGGAGCGDVGEVLDATDTVPVHGLPPTLTLPREGGGDTAAGTFGRGDDGGEGGNLTSPPNPKA